MILTTAAYGIKYVKYVNTYLDKLLPYFDNHFILTDQPSNLEKFNTVLYHRGIWSYVEKLIFALKVAIENKSDVVFIDADELHKIPIELLQEKPFVKNKINYIQKWLGINIYRNTGDDFKTFRNYFEKIKKVKIPENLPLVWEYFYYFPYSDKLKDLLHTLEQIQPILEYNTLVNTPPDIVITGSIKTSSSIKLGSGEGIALAIAAFLTGIEFHELNSKYKKSEN